MKAAEEEIAYMSKKDLKKQMTKTRKNMERAAKELDFMQAAKYRDQLKMLEKQMGEAR